uniref:Uncharacterized protein n=1 Tax=Oryza brachyantha TaxID=4533 RepID=J3LCF2_ORYBR
GRDGGEGQGDGEVVQVQRHPRGSASSPPTAAAMTSSSTSRPSTPTASPAASTRGRRRRVRRRSPPPTAPRVRRVTCPGLHQGWWVRWGRLPERR